MDGRIKGWKDLYRSLLLVQGLYLLLIITYSNSEQFYTWIAKDLHILQLFGRQDIGLRKFISVHHRASNSGRFMGAAALGHSDQG